MNYFKILKIFQSYPPHSTYLIKYLLFFPKSSASIGINNFFFFFEEIISVLRHTKISFLSYFHYWFKNCTEGRKSKIEGWWGSWEGGKNFCMLWRKKEEEEVKNQNFPFIRRHFFFFFLQYGPWHRGNSLCSLFDRNENLKSCNFFYKWKENPKMTKK
jgi:hypothetical protein